MRKIYTLEEIEHAFATVSSVTELREKYPQYVTSAQKRGIYSNLRDKYNLKPLTPFVRSDEDLRIIALKYSTRSEFSKKNQPAHRMALRRGIMDEICSHMPGACRPAGYWTKDRCIEAALQCSTVLEFRTRFKGALAYSEKHNFYKEVTSHFDRFGTMFTHAYCKAIALTCDTKKEFRVKYPSIYQAILANGWLGDLCSHQKSFGNSDNDTIYILASDQPFQGRLLYKIGVTSWRLENQRWDKLRLASGFHLEPILHARTIGKATDLEKELLGIGRDPQLRDFDGSTEYRAWKVSDFHDVIKIASNKLIYPA